MSDPTPPPPNILLVVADQHRGDFLPWTGRVPLQVPALRALADRGVTFRRAVTPSPLCAPARACLATGRDYPLSGVRHNGEDLPRSAPTYYQRLRRAGYSVTGVGKFDLHKASSTWGVDGRTSLPEWGFTAGIDNEGKLDAVRSGAEAAKGPYMAMLHRRGLAATHVADYRNRDAYTSTYPTPLPDDAYCDNWVGDNALTMLREHCPPGAPWHLVVNFVGPHDPMDVTASMLEAVPDGPIPLPADLGHYDAATHTAIRRNYVAMIENIDRNLGRVLEEVRRRGEEDRTVVIYTSDHGDMLGDAGLWGKSTWHHPSVWIPLVVAGPGVRAAASSEALVQLHDLAATILDLAGVEPTEMESRSLVPVLSGATATHRDVVTSGLTLDSSGSADLGHYGADGGGATPGAAFPLDWRLVYDGRCKLVTSASGWSCVYDLDADPDESQDLGVDSPEGRRLLEHLA